MRVIHALLTAALAPWWLWTAAAYVALIAAMWPLADRP